MLTCDKCVLRSRRKWGRYKCGITERIVKRDGECSATEDELREASGTIGSELHSRFRAVWGVLKTPQHERRTTYGTHDVVS